MLSKVLYTGLLVFTAFITSSFLPISSLSSENINTADSAIFNSKARATLEQKSTVEWQSCTQSSFDSWFPSYAEVDSLECATIDIPLINQTESMVEPTVIKLAISRLPSTGRKEDKLGTLISISGGPGQSGLDVSPIDSAAYKKLSKHFDIIGYAPRGVRPSTPTVKCSTVERVLYPEDVASFAQGCWQYTPADLLTQLGADYAVDDIESIRQALGEPKISLIGYSYGTKIAALYAEKFPQQLRAGVLDGIVNLNETDFQGALNQSASIQQTFERFVRSCQQQADCYFSASNLPITHNANTDNAKVKAAEAKLAKLYRYIENNTLYDLDGQRILAASLSQIIYDFLMWPDQWPILNELFYQLDAKDFELFKLMIADSKDNTDFATFAAIICADGAPTAASKPRYIDEVKRVDALVTWDDYREFTDKEIADACYYWPVAGSDVPHIPKLSAAAPPLLLVAQTNDPATPYINALAMQKYLNATLLTRKSDGHTLALSNLSSCIDDKVVNYLIDPNRFAKKEGASAENNLYCSQ